MRPSDGIPEPAIAIAASATSAATDSSFVRRANSAAKTVEAPTPTIIRVGYI